MGAHHWTEGEDRVFWIPGPVNHLDFIGMIALQDCILRDCRFTQVGMLVQPKKYAELTGKIPECWGWEEEDLGEGEPTNQQ